MIICRAVHYFYPAGQGALYGIDLEVKEGEIVLVLGANGSGKSTLLKLMAGLMRPTQGSISLFGVDPASARASDVAALLGLVFQNPDHQLFASSVLEELLFGVGSGVTREEALARAEELLRLFGLWQLRRRSPFTLSWGQKKRLCLAVALMRRPRALALDEPTLGQDHFFKLELTSLLKGLALRGAAVLVATHDMDFAWSLQGRAVILALGRVLAEGPTERLLADEGLLARAGLRPPALVRLWKELGRPGPGPFTTKEEAIRRIRDELALP
ncbi:MAG: hypothetical protein C4339_03590 [Nitrososphaerota archaeon]